MWKIPMLLIASALFPFLLSAETWDEGTSTNLIVKAAVSENWYVGHRSNLASQNGTDFFFGYVDATVGRELRDNWSLDAGYRHAWFEMPNQWRDEYRPIINLAWSRFKDGWYVSNRHRLEFRFFEDDLSEDRVRYRNETRIVFPWKHWGMKPFIEEEFFFETKGRGFNLNWLTTGVRFDIADGMIGKAGYRWQAAKFGGEWSHRHVFVTGLIWLID